MTARIAKNNALKALQSNKDDSISSEEGESADIINTTNTNSRFNVARTSQNAPEGFSLDLFKQYKRRIDFCDRDLIKIHDKSSNKKDQGSEDKGLVYVDFQAGMFEAIKVNFIKCLESDFKTKLIAEPKLEYYGEALDRVCLDLRMIVGDHNYDVKVKVHNTKCSLDVSGFHGEVAKRHPLLNNLTVGEYFAEHILTSMVEKINTNVNITELNDKLRELATEGKKAAKSKTAKKQCKKCEKDLKGAKTLKCHTCKDTLHYDCLPEAITNDGKEIMSKNDAFQCGSCQVYSIQITNEETDSTKLLAAIKLNAVLPFTVSESSSVPSPPSTVPSLQYSTESSVAPSASMNMLIQTRT